MSEELKPCPFCGGEAELDTSQAYRALSGGTLGSRAAVYCARCGADMGFCYEDAPGTPREDIVNQVVDDWNRRAPSPDMREAVEALRVESEIVENLAWAVEQSTAKAEVLEEALKTVQASLVAAMSLIIRAEDEKKRPSKVVASDAMFLQMLKDYDAATSTGRAALRSLTGAKP